MNVTMRAQTLRAQPCKMRCGTTSRACGNDGWSHEQTNLRPDAGFNNLSCPKLTAKIHADVVEAVLRPPLRASVVPDRDTHHSDLVSTAM